MLLWFFFPVAHFVLFQLTNCLYYFPLFVFLDSVDISVVPEESIDQVAVVTSNILFFIIMFIFAVFETYVFSSQCLRNVSHI